MIPFPIRKVLLAATLCLSTTSAAERERIDAVERGEALFSSVGCIECHTVAKGDTSMKTGPNLYGLFLSQPRKREVEAGGKRRTIKANRGYFQRSLRKSWDELAVAESGPTAGQAYQPVMPLYVEELVSEEDSEALWHYLRTLADADQRGPAEVLVERTREAEPTDLIEVPGEEIVLGRTRVMRAPVKNTSGRAIHVGQPNGMSYSFDPRMLGVRRIWTGGYLNLNEERRGRGKPPSSLGRRARVRLEGAPLVAPLTAEGALVDFEFKEPDVYDELAIEKHLYDAKDFTTKLEGLDAEFLGYSLEPATGNPGFRFRVGANRMTETLALHDDGGFTLTLRGGFPQGQQLKVATEGVSQCRVDGGVLEGDLWNIPATAEGSFRLRGRLAGGVVAIDKPDVTENLGPQELVSRPAAAGQRPLKLPDGYALEDWLSPRDVLGREQLFEPTGIDVAKDGTIVVGTRTAGVWRIRDGQWQLFAEGTFEVLGVVIEDDCGDRVVISQKPELTRLVDTDGDGRADDFETVCDDYGFHANYHEYTHGPVRDAAGNYYFLLNLAHERESSKASWRAGGRFMGSMGGFRGWAMKVAPNGRCEPFASGLRSPAGLGISPAGRLWYAENQGEYVGSSKLVPLEEGKFYGHPSALVTAPRMIPGTTDLEACIERQELRKGAVWLPHGEVANSPGSPTWDRTGGRFGPFGGQVFIGDQTLSHLLRIVTEQVRGQDQGCVIPFGSGFASGVMRPVFLPDGSLVLGQTGRGWGARGGGAASLQRVVYDGETIAADIHAVSATASGFELRFTRPLAGDTTAEDLQQAFQIRSWFYTNQAQYGSPKRDQRDEKVTAVEFLPGRRSVRIHLQGFDSSDEWTDRVYHLRFAGAEHHFERGESWQDLNAYYTLRAVPAE